MQQIMNHRLQLSIITFLLAVIVMPLRSTPSTELTEDPTASIYSIANSKKKSGRHISISPQVSYTEIGNKATSSTGISVYETSATHSSGYSPSGAFGGQLSGGVSASKLMSSGSKYGWSGAGPASENTSDVVSVGPRRVGTDNPPPGPFPDPIGDAMIPLAVLACAYLIWRVMRKRKRA